MLSSPIVFNHVCNLRYCAGSLWFGTLANDVHPGTQHFHTIFVYLRKLNIYFVNKLIMYHYKYAEHAIEMHANIY